VPYPVTFGSKNVLSATTTNPATKMIVGSLVDDAALMDMGLTIELSGRTKSMNAVPDADHSLAAAGTARSPDAVCLNEWLGLAACSITQSL
jgi:hypothetical protein